MGRRMVHSFLRPLGGGASLGHCKETHTTRVRSGLIIDTLRRGEAMVKDEPVAKLSIRQVKGGSHKPQQMYPG